MEVCINCYVDFFLLFPFAEVNLAQLNLRRRLFGLLDDLSRSWICSCQVNGVLSIESAWLGLLKY